MSLSTSLDCQFYFNGVEITENMTPLDMEKINQIIKDTIQAGADAIAYLAQLNAPVRTGRLRDSIHSVPTETGAYIEASAPYAAPVNFGHITASGSFVKANPFFTNAVEQVLPEIEREIEEQISMYLRYEK